MKLRDLLQRENFGNILERTLSGYLLKSFDESPRVRWYERIPDKIQAEEQLWLCNAHLNAIFVPGGNPRRFDPLRREYGRSPLWWRTPLHATYVASAFTRLGARYFAHAALGITPACPQWEEILIVPGNHKVRIINIKDGEVVSILKNGARSRYLEAELDGRKRAGSFGIPVPSVIAESISEGWIRERYVLGTPLNRLSDQNLGRRSLATLTSDLIRLSKTTLRSVPVDRYLEFLKHRVQSELADNEALAPNLAQAITYLAERCLNETADLAKVVGDTIHTAFSHGDFQAANLLQCESGPMLIDWEYSGQRVAGFDPLVSILRSRFPQGLAKRLTAFTAANGASGFPLDWFGPGGVGVTKPQRDFLVRVFLVEELLVQLEENTGPNIQRVGGALKNLTQEGIQWLDYERQQ